MARGNALNKAISIMVTMIHLYGVPLEHFTVSHRERRTPKTMTESWLKRHFLSFVDDEGAAKKCASAMNSARPHLGLLAQKLFELKLHPVAYECPAVHPGVGLTAADLVCEHGPTGALVVIEVKTGGCGYLLDVCGRLAPPFESVASCVLTHWQLQLAYTYDWMRRTYIDQAALMCTPLLIRVSPTAGALHYPLPRSFRDPPSLA